MMYRENADLADNNVAAKLGQTAAGDRSGDEVGDAEKAIGTRGGVETHEQAGEKPSA